jgi:hypothetical protein
MTDSAESMPQAVVRAVADRQVKDDRINQKFARTNKDRLIKEFVD